MNISEIKDSIAISDYLSSIGIKPARKYQGQWWYHSPLRLDKKPSFVVNLKKGKWFDVAAGNGGDLINLVKLLHNTDPAGAIAILTGNSTSTPVFPSYQQNDESTTGGSIEIKHIQPIRSPALIQYLNERLVPVDTAKRYLKEAFYITGPYKKQFFALSFENDLGGFALRNCIWKGAVSPAHFTTIKGKSSSQLNIFEGVFDFLSALVFFKSEIPKRDCLILNSTSHLNKVLPLLDPYQRINLFLDNDEAGQSAADKIKAKHHSVVDFSSKIYPEHKDFNEFLMSTKKAV